MTMQNIQNGSNDKLHKQYKNLEQVWDSIKRSKSQCRHRRRKHSSPMANGVKVQEDEVEHGLFDYSSPQQNHRKQSGSSEEEEWNVRTNDLAVLEMLSERKDSMRGGKFKGKSLHDALESASKMGKEVKEEEDQLHFQSGWCSSSDLIQGSGVKRRLFPSRSSSECECDDDEDQCECGDDDYCNCSSSSNGLFSSSLLSAEKNGAKEKKDQVVAAVGEWNSEGGKWMALMGWVAVLLVVFALGIITWKSFDGYSPSFEYDDFCYPT